MIIFMIIFITSAVTHECCESLHCESG